MQPDLSGAIGAVEWGESQLPILSSRLRAWEAENVQLTAVDLNPPCGKMVAVASAKAPPSPILQAEVGAIIGSFRSALDLLCAALAARNGTSPSPDTHFPIFRSHQEMIDPKDGVEGKKWLSTTEIRLIKSLHPYEGGNNLLWALHRLDILRKHERLIACSDIPRIDYAFGRDLTFPTRALDDVPSLKDKPQMFEFPRDRAKPDAQMSVQVTFDEIGLTAVYRRPVIETLDDFARLAHTIIERFDAR